ncbi:MAG TPA: zf-HC2 domain-containing protein [Pyrinomonadaceae bacterium]|nr:zf-HC2 domain-containing protein [Pyrinomonadaceae bacterium]
MRMEERNLTTLISALLPREQDEPYHLTEAELVAYVDGDADDVARELAETHLEVCSECTHAFEKLRVPVVAAQPLVPTPARWGRIAALALLVIGVVLVALYFWTRTPQQTPGVNHTAGGDVRPENAPSPVASESPNVVSKPVEDESILNREEISPSLRKAIQSAWTNQRLDAPEFLAQLKGVQGRLLGESSDGVPFPLVGPIGKVVQTRTPTLSWKALQGAEGYTVLITDDKLEEVASSPRVTDTRWTVPAPLQRGRVYSWQVTAIKDGQRVTSPVLPAPQAMFKVLEKSRDDELRRLKQSLPDYHLGLGVFYTQAGMIDEAEQEFQALARETPGPTATKLLQTIRAMKR